MPVGGVSNFRRESAPCRSATITMELEVQQVLMCLGCVYGLKLTLGLLLELRNGLLGYLLPQLRHYILGPADLKTR